MKLKFTDWEIEKEFVEDFWGYDHRYGLDEVISEDEDTNKCKAKLILRTNDYGDIVKRIGEIALSDENNNRIEFVENESILKYRIR